MKRHSACRHPGVPFNPAAWLAFVAVFFTASWARADFYISNGDTVELFDNSGSLVNANFAAVQGATGLAVGPDGNLYVATASPSDGFGAEVDSFNAVTGTPVGTPFVSHVSDNGLNNPAGIAFGPDGHLYVGDLTSYSIFVYNNSGSRISQLSDASLNTPASLAFAPGGALFTADDANILSYSAGTFTTVNNAGAFSIPHDVGVGLDGNLYVLDISGSTAGIYQLNPGTGAASRIVDYSTSPFYANDLSIGPDGDIYVSGQDSGTGANEVLRYGTDGSGGAVFANLGTGGTGPTYMAFAPAPEPSTLALLSIAGAAAAAFGLRRKNSRK